MTLQKPQQSPLRVRSTEGIAWYSSTRSNGRHRGSTDEAIMVPTHTRTYNGIPRKMSGTQAYTHAYQLPLRTHARGDGKPKNRTQRETRNANGRGRGCVLIYVHLIHFLYYFQIKLCEGEGSLWMKGIASECATALYILFFLQSNYCVW